MFALKAHAKHCVVGYRDLHEARDQPFIIFHIFMHTSKNAKHIQKATGSFTWKDHSIVESTTGDTRWGVDEVLVPCGQCQDSAIIRKRKIENDISCTL